MQRIVEEYPGISRISAYDGFGESPQEALQYILKDKSDLVLVGMGMGRQEAFLLKLIDAGWRGAGLCVGGFFDKLANPELEYQPWAEKTRLRFLGRLVREPRRLSRRYFIDYQRFILLFLKNLPKRKMRLR